MPGTKKKYRAIIPVEVYRMAKAGMSQTEMESHLGVNHATFWRWQSRYPELKQALEMAQKELEDGPTFPQWVYSRLPDNLKELWDQIEEWEHEPNAVAKIELMLADHGKRVRQQMFLHALCMSNFSPSTAMARVGLSKSVLDRWIAGDAEFAELVEEIQWHKANFFEESLCKLVAAGHPAAVIFANRSYNAKRGYASQSEVSVNGQVSINGTVLHGVLDLSELIPYLTNQAKQELLEAIRKRDYEKSKALSPQVMPSVEELVSQEITRVSQRDEET